METKKKAGQVSPFKMGKTKTVRLPIEFMNSLSKLGNPGKLIVQACKEKYEMEGVPEP